MKNKTIYNNLIFFQFFSSAAISNEQFQFDVTEVEILNNGNLFKGLKEAQLKQMMGLL